MFHEPAPQGNAHEIKFRRVAYFYSAAERHSRGVLWPSFAPARRLPAHAGKFAMGLASHISRNNSLVNISLPLSHNYRHSSGSKRYCQLDFAGRKTYTLTMKLQPLSRGWH